MTYRLLCHRAALAALRHHWRERLSLKGDREGGAEGAEADLEVVLVDEALLDVVRVEEGAEEAGAAGGGAEPPQGLGRGEVLVVPCGAAGAGSGAAVVGVV